MCKSGWIFLLCSYFKGRETWEEQHSGNQTLLPLSVPRPALLCGPPAPDCYVPLRWCQHRQPERGEPWAEWVDVACGARGVVGGGV